jgi:hypothetical protein
MLEQKRRVNRGPSGPRPHLQAGTEILRILPHAAPFVRLISSRRLAFILHRDHAHHSFACSPNGGLRHRYKAGFLSVRQGVGIPAIILSGICIPMLYSGIANRVDPIGVDHRSMGEKIYTRTTISPYPYPQSCIEGHFFPRRPGIYICATPVRALGLLSRRDTRQFFFDRVAGPAHLERLGAPRCKSSLPSARDISGCASRQLSLFPSGGYLDNVDKKTS